MNRLWPAGLLALLLPLGAAAEDAPVAVPARALEDFQEMFDRPLFSNTRRPAQFSEEGGVSLDEQQLRDSWRLAGIVLRGERQSALLRQRQGELSEELEVGMALEGDWVLEHIAPDHVLLVRNQTAVQLLLREPVEPGTQPPAEAAAPAEPNNKQTAPAKAPAAAPANPDNAVPAPNKG